MATSVAGIQEEALGLKVSINEFVLCLKQQSANRPGKAQVITESPAGGSDTTGVDL